MYQTSEHLYHCKKFTNDDIIQEILRARSAHDAQQIATKNVSKVRADWSGVKREIMKEILLLK